MMTAMRGTTLPAAVSKLCTRFSVSCCMSAESSPRPVSQFSHAAFIAFTLPSMVVEASRAVVPAMFICSWMMWMASVTSANESMDRSAISPLASLTRLASEMRRSISSLVPP